MKKISLNILLLLTVSAFLFSGCSSLKKMQKNANTVNYTVAPEVLETHVGKVDATIQSLYPAKYFAKKVTLTVTPVLKYAGGETALASYTLQGEKVKGNSKVIPYVAGGSNSYKGSF